MKKIIAVLALLAAIQPAWSDVKNPYDESANAKAQVQAAQASAKAANKSTLIVFGANWCGDCKVLDMEMQHGALAKLVDERLVVVKVDVGRMDKNKDVTERFGNVIKKGIPSVVLLRADGNVAYQTNGGELADARKMGREGLTSFFTSMLSK
jgi:thioredoxin 1